MRFGRVHGVYITQGDETTPQAIWPIMDRDFLGPKKGGQINQMSQLLKTILLCESVVPCGIQPHVDGDGYQALYNMICLRHPSMSVSNMVQTPAPSKFLQTHSLRMCQRSNCITWLQESLAAVGLLQRNRLPRHVRMQHPNFKDELLSKVQICVTTSQELPYKIDLLQWHPPSRNGPENWVCSIIPLFLPSRRHRLVSTYGRPPVHALSNPPAFKDVSSMCAPSASVAELTPTQFPDHIIQPLAEDQVLCFIADPKAQGSSCDACHLTGHAAEDCHALINHVVANYVLIHNKALHQCILAKHKTIVGSRRHPPSHRPKAKEMHDLMDLFAALYAASNNSEDKVTGADDTDTAKSTCTKLQVYRTKSKVNVNIVCYFRLVLFLLN